MKKILSLTLALITLLSLASCGEELTPQQVLDKSLESLDNIKSVHILISNNIDYNADGSVIQSSNTIDGDVDFKNNILHSIITTVADGETTSTEMYMRYGATFDYYMQYSGKWVKMEGASSEVLNGLDIGNDILSDFTAYFAAMKSAGELNMTTEECEGVKCYRIYCPVTMTSLEMAQDFAVDTIVTDMLTEENKSKPEVVSTILEVLGAFDVAVYIDCDSFRPVRFMIDARKPIANLYRQTGGNSINIAQAVTTTTYTKYNKVGKITIPDAALNGYDLAALQQ